MTDRYQVYTKVLKVLKEMLTLSHPGHVLTLAMLIAGIVTGRNAQLTSVSAETATKAKDKSTEMRLRRRVKHESIDADVIYMPFAKRALEALSTLPLVLVMDGSQVGRGCMVLMVSALYQKRALPICWVVYKGKKGHTTAQRHIEALTKTLPLIPAAQVVLLGDAEYLLHGPLCASIFLGKVMCRARSRPRAVQADNCRTQVDRHEQREDTQRDQQWHEPTK